MNTMRVAQVPGPKREFEIVQRPIPDPTPGTVRIKVAACGICHSDALVKEGLWPGLQYPRVPGHEVSGTIDAVGEGVIRWMPGQRVGVGWHGGYCGRCDFSIEKEVTILDVPARHFWNVELLRKNAPAAIVSDERPGAPEGNFFERSWQQSFWGPNYPGLATVKKRYDPTGLFFVHHGVGSEDWSADGFTRLGRP